MRKLQCKSWNEAYVQHNNKHLFENKMILVIRRKNLRICGHKTFRQIICEPAAVHLSFLKFIS